MYKNKVHLVSVIHKSPECFKTSRLHHFHVLENQLKQENRPTMLMGIDCWHKEGMPLNISRGGYRDKEVQLTATLINFDEHFSHL
jgi:hypothetical protein